MRALKIVGLILAGLVLLTGAAIAALAVGGSKLIAGLIESRISIAMARQVTIGHLDVRWGSPLRLTGENIRVANATWGSTPDMFTAKHLDIELDSRALLRLSLRIQRLVAEEPALFLETSADGKPNWRRSDDANASPLSRFTELRTATLHHGRFHFHNGQSGAETDTTVDGLSLEAAAGDNPVNVTAAGTFQRQPFAVTAAIAPLTRLQDQNDPYPVKLDGHLGTNNFVVDGTIAEPFAKQALTLRVDLKGQNIQDFLATLGVPIPKMPIYRLAGELRRDGAQWRFSSVTGHIGDSHVGGEILVDESGTVPYIRAAISAEYLDLADLRGFYGGDPGKHPQAAANDANDKGRVIPDMRLPISKLLGLNVDVSLEASRVKPAAGLPFETVAFTLALKDGALRLNPVRVAIAHGEVLGDLSYGSTASPPSFHADIEINHIDLHRLLAGTDIRNELKRTEGVLGGSAKLDSTGAAQRQIMAGLHGDIGLFLQGGRMSAAVSRLFEHDIAEALGLAPTSHQPHPINCLIARFGVRSGVATSTALLLDTDKTVVAGQGNVNLADETLFLDLRPFPKRAGLSRFGVPLEIRGTFAAPEVESETVGLAKRLGAAMGLMTPPAVLLPLIDTGLGDKNKCQQAFASPPPMGEGSSTPPRR